MRSDPVTERLSRIAECAFTLTPGEADLMYDEAEPAPIPSEDFTGLVEGTLDRVRLPAHLSGATVRDRRTVVAREDPAPPHDTVDWDDLIRQVRSAVAGYRAALRDQDPDDIVQDVCLEALRISSHGTLPLPSNPGWIHTVVRRHALRQHRASRATVAPDPDSAGGVALPFLHSRWNDALRGLSKMADSYFEPHEGRLKSLAICETIQALRHLIESNRHPTEAMPELRKQLLAQCRRIRRRQLEIRDAIRKRRPDPGQ